MRKIYGVVAVCKTGSPYYETSAIIIFPLQAPFFNPRLLIKSQSTMFIAHILYIMSTTARILASALLLHDYKEHVLYFSFSSNGMLAKLF